MVKHLLFTLDMPNVGSWNGKWSGEGRLYARVRTIRSKADFPKAKKILDEGYFRYDFGDGWSMSVDVSEVDAKTKTKILKKTKGFCGYDWAIDSIMQYNDIFTRKQIENMSNNVELVAMDT